MTHAVFTDVNDVVWTTYQHLAGDMVVLFVRMAMAFVTNLYLSKESKLYSYKSFHMAMYITNKIELWWVGLYATKRLKVD